MFTFMIIFLSIWYTIIFLSYSDQVQVIFSGKILILQATNSLATFAVFIIFLSKVSTISIAFCSWCTVIRYMRYYMWMNEWEHLNSVVFNNQVRFGNLSMFHVLLTIHNSPYINQQAWVHQWSNNDTKVSPSQ